jgi:hypothetical protein
VGRLEQIKRNYQFFNAPVGLFITIDRGLGPCQWADLGGYINTLAFLARGYGLDTCPQVAWIRLYKIVGAFLQLPPEQMLFCGMAIGYCDRSHPVNSFRSSRAELHEFCKFYGRSPGTCPPPRLHRAARETPLRHPDAQHRRGRCRGRAVHRLTASPGECSKSRLRHCPRQRGHDTRGQTSR